VSALAKQLAGSAEVQVGAPVEKVFATVTDVTRVREWSPECYRCEWLDGATGPAVGARFRGHNRRGWLRWKTTCRVTHVEKNRIFAFEVVQPIFGVQTRWRYEMMLASDGTSLKESFQVLWLFPGFTRFAFGGGDARQEELVENVRQTLGRIKGIVEGSPN
jgi:uncharacterized protein YndB with AHSA1/START domain